MRVTFEQQDKFSALIEEHFNNPEYCGVRIIADDGTQFYCAEYALRCGSEVFHKMLSHDMREKISGEVHIGDAASDIIGIMLCFMHSGKCSLESTNLLPVMRIALRYQVNHLVSVCEEYRNNYFSVDKTNCFCILNQIYMFPEMPQALRQQCQHVILQNFAVQQRNFTVQEGFLDLSYLIIEDISKTAFSYMFLHQQLPAGYVNFVLALLGWLDHDQTRRQSKALSLLSSLEFEALGFEGIAQISNREFSRKNWVREHPALEQKTLNALSMASRIPKHYTGSQSFACEPGRWTFACKVGKNSKGKGVNAVMATFDIENTTKMSVNSCFYASQGCSLHVVCKKGAVHLLLAVSASTTRDEVLSTLKLNNRNVCEENRCCAFSHDARAELSTSHSSGSCQEFSYVHPLAVEVEKCEASFHQNCISVLARPKITTTK